MMKRLVLTAALGVAALALNVGAAGASPNGSNNGTKTTVTAFTASYSAGDIGGNYVCSGIRTTTTAGKNAVATDTQDTETCSLSDISQFAAGTYTGKFTVLASPWGPSLVGTHAAVYTDPSYPLYAPGTIKNGVDVGGEVVPWIWYSDYDGAIATSITLIVTANGSGGGTLNVVAHYNKGANK